MSHRIKIVSRLLDILGNDSKSKNIEISIYNWTIQHVKNNKIEPVVQKKKKSEKEIIFDNSLTWDNNRFVNVYHSKCRSIVFNLKNKNNPDFLGRVKSGDIKSKDIVAMTSEDIFPALWKKKEGKDGLLFERNHVRQRVGENNILKPVVKNGLKNLEPVLI